MAPVDARPAQEAQPGLQQHGEGKRERGLHRDDGTHVGQHLVPDDPGRPAPSERAACTCSRARMPRATPQATRANCGAYRMPMVATSVGRLPPIKASTTNATKISGRDTNTSTTRMAAASARRPRKATPTPMATRDGGGRHRQRHARAMHGARQQVAAQLVGAQPMLPGGRGQQIGRIDLVRILQAQHGTEGGGQRHQQQEGRRQPGRQRGGQKRGGRRTAASTETGRALMPAACGCGDRPAPGPGRWPG